MTSAFPLTYFMFLLFFLILLFSAGLTLLILGLILKKPRQWISGIVICAVSLIGGIFWLVSLISKFPEKLINNNHYKFEYHYSYPDNSDVDDNDDYDADDKEDSISQKDKTPQFEREQNTKKITGFIQDSDKSLIFIRIYPDAVFDEYGIVVNKIDTYNTTDNTKKEIPLNITFNNKFKGQLQLILFTSDDTELARSYVEINQKENSTFTVKFAFDKSVNFLKINYARLKTSD